MKLIHLHIERRPGPIVVITTVLPWSGGSAQSMAALPSDMIATTTHLLESAFIAGDTIVYCSAIFSSVTDTLRAAAIAHDAPSNRHITRMLRTDIQTFRKSHLGGTALT